MQEWFSSLPEMNIDEFYFQPMQEQAIPLPYEQFTTTRQALPEFDAFNGIHKNEGLYQNLPQSFDKESKKNAPMKESTCFVPFVSNDETYKKAGLSNETRKQKKSKKAQNDTSKGKSSKTTQFKHCCTLSTCSTAGSCPLSPNSSEDYQSGKRYSEQELTASSPNSNELETFEPSISKIQKKESNDANLRLPENSSMNSELLGLLMNPPQSQPQQIPRNEEKDFGLSSLAQESNEKDSLLQTVQSIFEENAMLKQQIQGYQKLLEALQANLKQHPLIAVLNSLNDKNLSFTT